MAGDWIKVRVNLADEPEVGRIATILKIDEDAVLGKLIRVWSLSDQHTADGNFVGLSSEWLDARMRCHGFASALASVGWLEIAADGLRIPKFNRHNGKSAKSRAKEAQDKRRRRVRKMSGKCPDEDGTPSSLLSLSESVSSPSNPEGTGEEHRCDTPDHPVGEPSGPAEVLEWMVFHGHFGQPVAMGIIRNHGTTMADCLAWQSIRETMPVRHWMHAIKGHKNPAAYQAHEARVKSETENDTSRSSDPVKRETDVMKKRGDEVILASKVAERQAEPPPADMVEQVRKRIDEAKKKAATA